MEGRKKGEAHKITRPISTRFNAIDGTYLTSHDQRKIQGQLYERVRKEIM